MSRIYVASSWRNEHQPAVVEALRRHGHEVYDFRNPPDGTGFAWSEIGLETPCTVAEYRAALRHPRAAQGFLSDFRAMKWADVGLLLLPCGRSAHLELGWMAGAGKRTIILTRDAEEPELMALLADHIVGDFESVLALLRPHASQRRPPLDVRVADFTAEPDGGDRTCGKCHGEGKVADSDEQEPWSAWQDLPPGSDLAVRLGVVKPIACPACGGSGKAAA